MLVQILKHIFLKIQHFCFLIWSLLLLALISNHFLQRSNSYHLYWPLWATIFCNVPILAITQWEYCMFQNIYVETVPTLRRDWIARCKPLATMFKLWRKFQHLFYSRGTTIDRPQWMRSWLHLCLFPFSVIASGALQAVYCLLLVNSIVSCR